MRHTFISRLVMAGVDLKEVMVLAGHKTIKMTLRYAHHAPGHHERALAALDSYCDPGERVEQKIALVKKTKSA